MPGTDHAGIATQNVVKRSLQRRRRPRHDLGASLWGEVWKWKSSITPPSPASSRTGLFLRLGPRTLYKGRRAFGAPWRKFLCNCTTRAHLPRQIHNQLVPAVPDRLVGRGSRAQGIQRKAVPFQIPFKSRERFVTVATTRPETMLGDTAVAVNPADQRYASLVGQTAGIASC